MSRLIYTDKLKKAIIEYFKSNISDSSCTVDAVDCNADICRLVGEQPTAFDVDSVINKLNREKFIESETVLSDIHQGYNAGLSRAIEIVKRGGRDEA